MGGLFTKLKRNSGKNEKYRDSQSDIYYFVMQSFSHFLAGLFIGLSVFIFSIFLTLGVDTTQASVISSNTVVSMLLMAVSFSLVAYMGMRGAFGYSFFEMGLGSYEAFLTFAVGVFETRIDKKNWGQILLVFVHIASTTAGIFATAALFKASFGAAAIPSLLKPVVANAVQQNLGWAYLWSALVYTGIFLTITLTTNATSHYYSNLLPGCAVITVLGLVLMYTNRMLPSFAFNWPWCYVTDSYDLLAIDVAGGFTGFVVVSALYWVGYSRLYNPSMTQRYDTAWVPYAMNRYTKLEDKYNMISMAAKDIVDTRTKLGDKGAKNYYDDRRQLDNSGQSGNNDQLDNDDRVFDTE
jgi:hypothetical protein